MVRPLSRSLDARTGIRSLSPLRLYLPRYRRAEHLVAAIDLRQDRLGRATFQVPAGISTIVLPDLYANSAETPGRVERVTARDGAVIFVAHAQPGDQLRVGPGYARIVAH
jgi:hypothetical protein